MVHRTTATLRALALVSAFLLLACGSSTQGQGIDRPNPRLQTVRLQIGSATVVAEVARTELERNRGLMYRTSLNDGEGMLFVFDRDLMVSFWMKNTRIPLSLGYITADGTLVQILDLEPFSEEPRPSERSIRYALEVPRGWFDRAGVKVGDRVIIPALP